VVGRVIFAARCLRGGHDRRGRPARRGRTFPRQGRGV